MHISARLLSFAVGATFIFACGTQVLAQTRQGPIRTVLAVGRVPSMVDAPMHLRLSRVLLPAGAAASYRGDPSAGYVLKGSLSVTGGRDTRSLQPGEGMYLASGVDLQLRAGSNASAEFLQYQLLPAANLAKPIMGTTASITELHRMAIPPATLKPGPYELSLIRVTLAAGAARPRPHTRSGAALYYVLAEGAITFWPAATLDKLAGQSRTEPRPVGAVQEEPYGFIHSWSPKPDAALILLQANVSQEGVPEIIFVK